MNLIKTCDNHDFIVNWVGGCCPVCVMINEHKEEINKIENGYVSRDSYDEMEDERDEFQEEVERLERQLRERRNER